MNKFVLPGQDDPIWSGLKAAIQAGFRKLGLHELVISFEVPEELQLDCVEVDSIELGCCVNEDGEFCMRAEIDLDFCGNGFFHPEGTGYPQFKAFDSEPEWDVLYPSIVELFSKAFGALLGDINRIYLDIGALREQLGSTP